MSEARDPRFLRGRRAGEASGSPRPPETLPRAGYTGAREVAYKRRAVKPSRKRRGPLVRWLLPLATAVALVGVPAVAGWWLLTAPQFALRHLEVVVASDAPALDGDGEPRLTAWVAERLVPLVGENLVRLPLERVPEAVGEHRWIERLEAGKRLPDRLRVVLHRHRPRVLLERPDGRWWATAEGRAIAPLAADDPWAPEDATALPVVTGAADGARVAAALAVAEELATARPAWGGSDVLQEIEVLSGEDFRIHTAALAFPLILRRGQVAPRVHWLEHLLPPLRERWGEPAAVDLRFARRIVVERPSTTPRSDAERNVIERSNRSAGTGT